MLDTGSLDRKIAIERNLAQQDINGEMIPNWQRIGTTRWARRKPIEGTERYTAQQFIAREQVIFTVRWERSIAELAPGDRVVYPPKDSPTDAQIYDIIAVHEMGWREALVISTARRAEALVP